MAPVSHTTDTSKATPVDARLPIGILLLLAGIQFTNILDFMVMMPLGPNIMRTIDIGTDKFGWLVASYEFAAAFFGIVAAFFIDRYERKTALLVCYTGFLLGTVACALSAEFYTLLAARAVTGAFGGVLGALTISFAADISPVERRGFAVSLIMGAFAVATVVGVPIGGWLADRYHWSSAFWFVVGVGVVLMVLSVLLLPHPPIHPHAEDHRFSDLLTDKNALLGLALMGVLVMSHFTIVPYISPYLVQNVGITESQLPWMYFWGGLPTIIAAPIAGKLTDSWGRLKLLSLMIFISIIAIFLITHLPPLPLSQVCVVAALFFVFASGRFIPVQAIATSAVHPARRGAFMSLSTATRDLSAAVTSLGGGYIVQKNAAGQLTHFNVLGWIAIAASLLSLWIASKVKAVETTPSTPAENDPTVRQDHAPEFL
jgi:predicted MFS family arabinose efflux permease